MAAAANVAAALGEGKCILSVNWSRPEVLAGGGRGAILCPLPVPSPAARFGAHEGEPRPPRWTQRGGEPGWLEEGIRSQAPLLRLRFSGAGAGDPVEGKGARGGSPAL